MCGIVGYVGSRRATDVLLPALKRLEYRGYDSAGVASLNGNGVELQRSVGKLENLERLLLQEPVGGTIGIGHTRWATHGRVSVENAHPHRAGRVTVIHNGIIENFLELRAELESRGRTLASETDTEVIAHLIDELVAGGVDFVSAVRTAARRLEGSFAIVALDAEDHDRLVAVKTATPIVIGLGENENLIASDVPALLDHTRRVVYLEDGEVAVVGRGEITLTDLDGQVRHRDAKTIPWDPVTAQKGGYRHFLLKEIHEQPGVLADTLRGRVGSNGGAPVLRELEPLAERLERVERVNLVACGTAWHACLVGKFLINALTDLPVDVDYGSEFRYRDLPLGERDLFVAVSQSGETADTLGSLERAKELGAVTMAVCNVVDSSIARRAEGVVYTQAGPEISVCSTKAFTTQLTTLLMLATALEGRFGRAGARGLGGLPESLASIPELVRSALTTEAEVERIAREVAPARDFLFLGRGIQYPIALEGALKLKEISYIHAEGYPAGEMKHGPIALITEEVPVVVLLPHDDRYSKSLANLKEVESRGGQIIVITDRATDEIRGIAKHVIEVPATHPLVSPIPMTIPLQLLAYYVAVERGTDVDQPRNLAKSVTVE